MKKVPPAPSAQLGIRKKPTPSPSLKGKGPVPLVSPPLGGVRGRLLRMGQLAADGYAACGGEVEGEVGVGLEQ